MPIPVGMGDIWCSPQQVSGRGGGACAGGWMGAGPSTASMSVHFGAHPALVALAGGGCGAWTVVSDRLSLAPVEIVCSQCGVGFWAWKV